MPKRTNERRIDHRPSGIQSGRTTGRGQQKAARQALGAVVYAARVGDLVKIGHTTDLDMRLRTLRHTNRADVELLGFAFGTREDEQAIHADLAEHLARGREYYHRTPAVLEVVDGMRSRLNLPALSR